MYSTPLGDRALEGAERTLFCEALAMMTDMVSDHNGPLQVGFPILDELQQNQQVALLLEVAHALLGSHTPAPPLTAVGEAAVAAVFQLISEQVAAELIDDDSDSETPSEHSDSWRAQVLAASRQHLELEEYPPVTCRDESQWTCLIECLSARVLWDHDWALTQVMDLDAVQRHQIGTELGIDDDYFVWVPLDPREDEAQRMIRELQYLTPAGRHLQTATQLDIDKIDEITLALLMLTVHQEDELGARAWKGLDWDVLNRLHEKGFISDPVSKAKSVIVWPVGLAKGRATLDYLLSRPE